ncbi:antibiotic biosynthesis monooxygenase [bacterium AH-315-J21]|nr:antibiotic biosynthesis monooxygenase [bacterium AH-315-J21]
MSEKTLRVVAILKAKSGKEQELCDYLKTLVEPTTKEDGYIRYEMHSNNADPSEFVFIEEWQSEAHLNAHLASPHLQAAIAKLPDLLAEELNIRRLTIVD